MTDLFLTKNQYLVKETGSKFIKEKPIAYWKTSESNKVIKDSIQWATVKALWGKIMEVTQNKVIVKCLVDVDNKVFQIRKFDITPFQGTVNLKINQYIEIKIYTRSGERKFTYRNANSEKLHQLFEPVNYFEGVENSSFFKPTNNSQNEGNL
jgi:hypothetical protein